MATSFSGGCLNRQDKVNVDVITLSKVVRLPKPITNTTWVRVRLCKLQKGALDSQPQVIKFTSCMPMVGGSLFVFFFWPFLIDGMKNNTCLIINLVYYVTRFRR
jgi:hypothetical protein